ncbi:DUF1501 domain-containing protein [Vibrio parahaemolyticus]|uniref:DUF1501 domain-containing protein n=1 Tax=Vibrio parahaemolyticus TaxID=670 RepID=UPI000F4D4A08|nr:DUF1501 domain-containing protein [Vibrio parahaemolyticus]EGQ7822021.1 DUF1501 domain-containing protein [Vibrio parahaemolyticus]EGR0907191.1 DUF1501 domain-containing protein [Vibrio parahaemolyticus]EGR5927033.1 DUF1501 domain-containing protein [Vibrio parahaemolyticus]EGV3809103.1 DUF1501 domain-containing protein [Vibrio parahaemolyticus]EHZ2571881.1 DUF1501 domain-containing protein [Vibrio parahaemolyticus]
MDISRRNFLKSTASFGAIASLGLPGYSLAAPSNDFRALICVYLAGGNDAINTILPLSDFHYNQYANVRGSLSVAKNTIIPIGLNANDANNNAVPLGLHPKLSALAPLFQQGDANLVLNSGILNQPVTKQAIEQGDVPLPEQLFSHNSQTASWLRGGMDASTNLGWAGRMLDVLTSDAQITPLYSVHGDTLWLKAMEHRQTVLKKDKAVQLTAVGNPVYEEIYQKLLSQSADNPFSGHFNLMVDESMMMSNILAEQLKLIDDAPLFSSSTLGKQMQTVYKLIASQSALSQQRQVFFVKHTGYDLHDSQLARHPLLLEDLATNLNAMYRAVDKLGMSKNVTTFTMSDFGRRMTNNGNGTDHGWGGHQLLIGGAVNGSAPIGTWPELRLGGQDDYSKGRLIPAIAADQVGSTLAQWMGVSDNAALEYVFPNIRNFTTSNLGFMA